MCSFIMRETCCNRGTVMVRPPAKHAWPNSLDRHDFTKVIAATVILGAALFSALSLIIGSLVKTRERFMGIRQVLTMLAKKSGITLNTLLLQQSPQPL